MLELIEEEVENVHAAPEQEEEDEEAHAEEREREEELEEEEADRPVRRPTKRRRQSPRPSRDRSPESTERRTKRRNEPEQPQGDMAREIRILKVRMISAMHDLKQEMKDQTSELREQNKILKRQNKLLKTELRTLKKELLRIRRRRQESSNSSDSSEDDDNDDDEEDDEEDDDDSDHDDGKNDGNSGDDDNASTCESQQARSREDEAGDREDSNDKTDSEKVPLVKHRGKTHLMSIDPILDESEFIPPETATVEIIETNPAQPDISISTEPLTDAQLFDAQTDVSILTVKQVKDFLKRHGWRSRQLNKMSVEDMRSEAVKIQFDLIAKLPEAEEASIQHDLMVTPRDYDIRARFNPARRSQTSRHRIVHWRYEDSKGYFLVKRITGDTQVFYSIFDLTRLIEEDLRKLIDLRLHNVGEDSKARAFEKFLRKTKKDNFDAISKKKTILKPETDRYLKKLCMTPREVIKEQFLAFNAEHVPISSPSSQLENINIWYLDERSYENVIEREGEESIRLYHPAELNQFNKTDLQILSENPLEGKREWNKLMLEFMWSTATKLQKLAHQVKSPPQATADHLRS